ncbi:hypothetical protein A3C25_01770 [Candidatus Roizmanbacteria bacterium RIFCSPHIGHO2_02_FULL_38_11]|uniref:Polysaccharide biosynthesis protein C-terminal domain-containing protein n=1 Tax=Candidatus Roizmanbacteria bacterium RIFCSPHIGHO2_02_FULL_38_11 TaxID=1802039 RepID=A0A1F7H181_9BACT|nr:MAG: hypothetical protein A3C25_01770 [Candidatus Roizmanbacteria bacterium RIFCSPHIGHO2_02_FULL_38_11]
MLKTAKKIWSNEFFKGGIFYTASSFVIHIMNYLFNFLAGRSLGPKGYAEISALFSYLIIALVPTVVFSTLLVQKISATSQNRVAYTYTLETLFCEKIRRWWFIAILPILFTPLLPILTNLTPLAAWSLFPLIILALLSTFYGSALQGLKLFLAFSLIGVFATFLKLLGALLVTAGIDGLATVLFFLILSSFFLFYLSKTVVTNNLRKKIESAPKKIERRILHIFKSRQFVIIFISTLSLTLLNNIDIVLVKKFFLAEDAGIYSSWSLFAKIILYLLGPLISLSFVFIAGTKSESSQNKTLIYSLVVLLFVGLVSFVFYKNFAIFIITFFFGSKFQAVAPFLARASIFGSFYAALTFLNSFYLAKNSPLALILPVLLPIYIVLFYLIPKKLSAITTLNIFFSAAVFLVYLAAYLITTFKKVTPHPQGVRG